jgi:SAM-dependent methyltransferase
MEEASCPICGPEAGVDPFMKAPSGKLRFYYVRCSGCGLVLLSPRPKREELREFYDEDYYGGEDRKFRPGIEKLRRLFAKARARRTSRLFEKPGRILDVGCGQGTFLQSMQEHGWEGYGTELSPQSAARARRSGLSVSVGEIPTDAYPAASFDLITFWQVLEHLLDPAAVMGQVRRLLRSGGVVAVSTPNMESWQAAVFGNKWFHLDAPRHLFLFSPRALEKIMAAHGFRLLKLSHFSWEQNPYGWLQSSLNCMGNSVDSLYTMIKDGSSTRNRRLSLAHRGKTCLVTAALLLPSVLLSVAESILKRGATIEAFFVKD